ncbi:MAG: preprotein translocase subunit SecE [Elusimicrobia bacterium]|nr:preprotein translocase subunit SecE [Elusimicrobiota bacterium]
MTPSDISQFFREAYAELKKATWLSRKEVIGSTVVIVLLVMVMALYISGVDFVLSIFLGSILGGAR